MALVQHFREKRKMLKKRLKSRNQNFRTRQLRAQVSGAGVQNFKHMMMPLYRNEYGLQS